MLLLLTPLSRFPTILPLISPPCAPIEPACETLAVGFVLVTGAASQLLEPLLRLASDPMPQASHACSDSAAPGGAVVWWSWWCGGLDPLSLSLFLHRLAPPTRSPRPSCRQRRPSKLASMEGFHFHKESDGIRHQGQDKGRRRLVPAALLHEHNPPPDSARRPDTRAPAGPSNQLWPPLTRGTEG